jgi:putative addiction module component (TIGR02574 family)
MDQAILEHEALKLPPPERAVLVEALLGSLDDEATRQTEAASAREAEDRYQAYQRGEIQALDGPAVLQELRQHRGT